MSPVARYWNGSAWADVAGLSVYEQPDEPAPDPGIGAIWIDTDAPSPTVGRLLGVQMMEGEGSGYTPGLVTSTYVTADSARLHILQLSYTPTVDVWWELGFFMGLMQKVNAAYDHLTLYLQLVTGSTPAVPGFAARVAGNSLATAYRTQHLGVQTYESYFLQKTVPLAAGVPVTVRAMQTFSGGTWQHNTVADYLWLQGKAYER